jgi:hypothetical protein
MASSSNFDKGLDQGAAIRQPQSLWATPDSTKNIIRINSLDPTTVEADQLALHISLSVAGQDAAVRPSRKRRGQKARRRSRGPDKRRKAEQAALLDYCESDVAALARLLPAMLPAIDLPQALLRGRYMAAAARMERNGVPIDTITLEQLQRHWSDIQDQLIIEIDAHYGVFEGRTFKAVRFAQWLGRTGIPWPRLESGRLDLNDDAFREVARAYPIVAPLRELRGALSEMRLSDLAVGRDGRNRTILSAFRARTSRNQPSNTKFIFGPSVWLRGLIQPPPGHGLEHRTITRTHIRRP